MQRIQALSMASTKLHHFNHPSSPLPFFFIRPSVSSPSRLAMRTRSCRCGAKSAGLGEDVFSVTQPAQCDIDYLGESTKGDLNINFDHLEAFGLDGQTALEGPIEEVAVMEAKAAEDLLRDLDIPSPYAAKHSPR